MIYPRCTVCHVPQYPHKLVGHQAYCTTPPRTGPGRPRKYPIGHVPHPYTYHLYAKHKHPHSHGGARRGEAWEWARITVGAQRQGVAKKSQQVGHESPRVTKSVTQVTKSVSEWEGELEEAYPLAYVCAVLQINRRTLWRWCKAHQIHPVRRRYRDGHYSLMRFILRSDLHRLILQSRAHRLLVPTTSSS